MDIEKITETAIGNIFIYSKGMKQSSMESEVLQRKWKKKEKGLLFFPKAMMLF